MAARLPDADAIELADVNLPQSAGLSMTTVLFAPDDLTVRAVFDWEIATIASPERDDAGDRYRISGAAIAFSPIPGWPNVASFDSVYRWKDATGRVGYGPVQSVWNERVQHAMWPLRSGPAGAV